jgi:CO dehydrogenase maturation factor
MSRNSVETRSVALCGKGGVGKTALAALLTRVLSKGERKLLVVDADPVVGLPQALGMEIVKTMADVSEEIIAAARAGGKKSEDEVISMVDYTVFEALIEGPGFALLAMGRREGEGCFCPVNDLLRDAIETLARNFDTILIDGEAGVEQINRRVTAQIDVPLIVTDASMRGIQAAALLRDVTLKREAKGAGRIGLVLNRVREGQEQQLRASAESLGLEVTGFIPEDDNITRHDLSGQPLLEIDPDSPALRAAREIARKLQLTA